MVEPQPPHEIRKPPEVQIPPRISKEYALGLQRLIAPALADAHNHLAGIPRDDSIPNHTQIEEFVTIMTDGLTATETLFTNLREKRVSLKPIEAGGDWTFNFSDEPNTEKLHPSTEYLDPSLTKKLNLAMREKIMTGLGVLSFTEIIQRELPEDPNTAHLAKTHLQITKTLDTVFNAKTMQITIDEKGQVSILPLEQNEKKLTSNIEDTRTSHTSRL